ncbi:electron transport complex subunit RsxC [Cognaticolwellia mytili]|uniref:electron transport complex subunit RsxC n=1 Tax=Cognaticolwellia mytili TaxID=1888913 RepID=UPI001F362188|nr:electron transport complex subunit RsxC [Cognaticolwellia mytili]
MESVIERIQKGHFSHFHGGIHPPEQKFLTSTKPIASAQIPEQLIIPVRQHIGQAGDIIVAVGDKVLKGQALSASNSPMQLPVHAPTSGIISAIENAVIPHPSGLSELCIIITPDHEDTWRKRTICPDHHLLSKDQILEKIANSGIAGMGGAGFPTQVKVSTLAKINYLIINAAECEPYITADDLLIQEHSPTVLDGIKILDHLLAPKNILIGIEDNKAKAIETLQKATADIAHIHVCVIPTKYPSGGEKQLIKILTNQEVPSGVLPSSLGIVMQNVATCFAIADAVINDTPLIKRVVTVSGQALDKPQNIWSLIGTPVGFLTQHCDYKNRQHKHLIMGGPMMGFSLSNDQIPVIKSTNCILAPSEAEIESPYSTGTKEVECIRCGQCADVCPAQLLPQELQWSAKAKDQQQLTKLNLFDCIECGACAYVCPSQIPLVHYYRVAKAEIRQQKLLDIKAEKAKVRFEARKERLEREKIARAEKHKKAAEARKARMNSGTSEAKTEKSAVAAALARVKAKKAQASTDDHKINSEPESTNEQASDKKDQVANAIARAKAKKLAKQAQLKEGQATENLTTDNDKEASISAKLDNVTVSDKKAKVAAAIAKAKAKKLQQAENSNDSLSTDTQAKSDEDKKAKVAAAVAKAKAKAKAKAAERTQDDKPDVLVANDNVASAIDVDASSAKIDIASTQSAAELKKARIAATIEKAKAKAKAKSSLTEETIKTEAKSSLAEETIKTEATAITEAPIPGAAELKKAKVAAAVAKAKAKKLAAQAQKVAEPENSEQGDDDNVIASATDSKKARIAAAVAKAKAKKLAADTNKSPTSE